MKWASKKCGLFAVLSALLFTALFTGSSASASSVFDGVYRSTSNWTISGGACTLTNLGTSWVARAQNPDTYRDGDENTRIARAQQAQSVISETMQSETGAWAITKYESYDGTRLRISLSPDGGSLDFVQETWNPWYKYLKVNSSNVYLIEFDWAQGATSDCDKAIASDGFSSSNTWYDFSGDYTAGGRDIVSTDASGWGGQYYENILAYGFTINYPPDYEGEPVNETWAPPRKPDFNYTVSSAGLLKVDYLDNAETKPDKAFEVQLTQTGDEWEMPLTPVDDRTISPAYAMGYEFQLPNPGYYHVGIFYEDESQLDGVALQFYWNGFSAVNGTTVGGCYDGDGVCNPELQEAHPIVRILNSLPVNDFGLQQLVRAPIDFFATLPGRAEECAPITLTMPFANAPVTLPCLTTAVFQPHFPTLLTIWQTVITGIVAYGISIKVFATVKNVQTPDNDRIEVAKL